MEESKEVNTPASLSCNPPISCHCLPLARTIGKPGTRKPNDVPKSQPPGAQSRCRRGKHILRTPQKISSTMTRIQILFSTWRFSTHPELIVTLFRLRIWLGHLVRLLALLVLFLLISFSWFFYPFKISFPSLLCLPSWSATLTCLSSILELTYTLVNM